MPATALTANCTDSGYRSLFVVGHALSKGTTGVTAG